MGTQNKELKNLTPQMVEELRTLGMEFERTQMNWELYDLSDRRGLAPYEIVLADYINDNMMPDLTIDGDNGDYNIPAPNCEELMDVLPEMHFVKGNPAWIKMYKLAGMWYIGYVCADNVTAKTFKDSSLLQATFELSKWVFSERKALLNLSNAIKGGSDE